MELPKDVPVFIVKMSTEDNRKDEFDSLLNALLEAKLKIKKLEEENKKLKLEKVVRNTSGYILKKHINIT